MEILVVSNALNFFKSKPKKEKKEKAPTKNLRKLEKEEYNLSFSLKTKREELLKLQKFPEKYSYEIKKLVKEIKKIEKNLEKVREKIKKINKKFEDMNDEIDENTSQEETEKDKKMVVLKKKEPNFEEVKLILPPTKLKLPDQRTRRKELTIKPKKSQKIDMAYGSASSRGGVSGRKC